MSAKRGNLLLIGLLVLVDLEVAQRVSIVRSRDDTQKVLELVLLQVLLGEVLEVTLGEWDLRGQDELGTLTLDRDVVTQLTGLAIDLDTVVQELFVTGSVKHVVRGRDGKVDDKLVGGSLGGSGSRGGLRLHVGNETREEGSSESV